MIGAAHAGWKGALTGVLESTINAMEKLGADRGNVVGVANHTNFIRAVREGTLTVVATPVQRGRTQQLWQVDVTDDADRLVARGEVRLANVPDAERLDRT